MGKGTFAVVWPAIGLITAILDMLDVLKLSLIGLSTTSCAQAGDVTCVSTGIEKLIIFMVDVITGPLILAANLMTNPFLGIIGIILGLPILWFVYGQGNSGLQFN